jgi:diaminopimelate decarboxylase
LRLRPETGKAGSSKRGGESSGSGTKRRATTQGGTKAQKVAVCGLTAARVEFRKQRRDGAWMIGVAMNRTQCRSTADDFLVDPLLLTPDRTGPDTIGEPDAIEGYLVGAYCIERELLTWRRMRFAR